MGGGSFAKAEAGSEVEGAHNAPDPGDTGEFRREEIREVEGATDDDNPGEATTPEPGLSPTETGSGGAQNIAGARISDRVARGQPQLAEPLFGRHGEGDRQG